MELSTFRVAITDGRHDHQNSTDDIEWQTAVTFMSDNSVTTAVVVATNQPVNGSLYQITSLEVYRGRRNITRIDHDGFFLSDEGIFRVYHHFCQVCMAQYIYSWLVFSLTSQTLTLCSVYSSFRMNVCLSCKS